MKSQRLQFAAILLPAILIGGCGGTLNRSVDSVHQPVVSRTDYTFDVQNTGDGLAAGESARLAGWLASLELGYGDRIHVDDSAGGDLAARGQIAALAAEYGLTLTDTSPVSAGAIAPGTMRVIISRMVATVPGCPDYSRQYEPNFGAHTASNYGCAINSNLAAMVARPEDLVRGQAGSGTTDPMTSGKPIQALRTRKTAVDEKLEAPVTSAVGNQ